MNEDSSEIKNSSESSEIKRYIELLIRDRIATVLALYREENGESVITLEMMETILDYNRRVGEKCVDFKVFNKYLI